MATVALRGHARLVLIDECASKQRHITGSTAPRRPCRCRRPGASLLTPAAGSRAAWLGCTLPAASAASSLPLPSPRWLLCEPTALTGVPGCAPEAAAGSGPACPARQSGWFVWLIGWLVGWLRRAVHPGWALDASANRERLQTAAAPGTTAAQQQAVASRKPQAT